MKDYDPTRIQITIAGMRPTVFDDTAKIRIAHDCRQALLHLEQMHIAYMPRYYEMCFARQPRYRVTRRGNVYDDRYKRTAWATWGFGTIRQRLVMAERFAEYMNAEEE